MCPSIAVMGGGGGGGGGSGNGADSGSGSGGAGGDGSGDGAGGDGRGANGGCGAGADGGGCPNHHGSGSASGSSSHGDPVDFATGHVFTTQVEDLVLGGPLPLRFWRSYSSAACEVDLGFGFGFAHTFGWAIEERRAGLVLRTPDGAALELDAVVPGEALLAPYGWLVHREGDGYALDLPSHHRLLFARQPGSQTYRLTSYGDRFGNRIELHYERGVLEHLVDAVGRVVRFSLGPDGRVSAIQTRHPDRADEWSTVASFVYDAAGCLESARDAEGFATRYAYDDRKRLVALQRPGGTVFHYRYDAGGRCIETWGAHASGAPDPSLDPDAPRVLADRETAARGVHHVRLSFGPGADREAVDSVAIHRGTANAFGKFDLQTSSGAVYSRTYDECGFLTSFTDPLGATTVYTRDYRGRETSITYADGAQTRIDRDADGDILRIVDAHGAETVVEKTPRGFAFRSAIDQLFQVELQERGLTKATIHPDGSRTSFTYDAHGNLLERRDGAGKVDRWEYDGWGRCLAHVDCTGQRRSFTWSERNHLLSDTAPSGDARRYTYDADGNLASLIDGRGTTRLVYGLAGRLHVVEDPLGRRTLFFNDREGRMTRVRNPAGEEHRFERRPDGLPTVERTFDGRTIQYRYDAAGRLLSRREGTDLVTYERDLRGRVTVRESGDGHVEKLTYDLRGEIVAARSPGVEVHFVRNALGWITSETQIVDGDAVVVTTDYDHSARLVRLTTSLGHSLAIERRPGESGFSMVLDGESRATIAVDPLGREISRALDGGGRIESTYDSAGNLSARRVLVAGTFDGRAGEPQWLGDSPRGASVDQRFQFAGELIRSEWDKSRGSIEYTYDPLGRLLQLTPESVRKELFRYDEAGRPHPADDDAPARGYAPGGVLQLAGRADYTYDDQRRLVAVREREADGRERLTTHAYRGGRLASTVLPDGTHVAYGYDAFGRRLWKKVTRAGKSLVSATRYVWEASRVVHETTTRLEADGGASVQTRTFAYDAPGEVPFAQRTSVRRDGSHDAGEWLHLLCDATGAPDRTVDRSGKVRSEWRRSAWGCVQGTADTPLRMLGQLADEETGLHYNWHRYYDPRIGRYLTPDPIGLSGGLDPFGYADNCPTSLVDPFGLMFTIIRGPPPERREIATGSNLQAGGTGTPSPHGVLGNPRASCSESAALHSMASGMTGTDAERRAEIARRFNEQGFTMETFEGNEEDYRRASDRERDAMRQNPCPQCSEMIQGLGIRNGVIGVDNRGRPGTWRPSWRMQPGRGRRR
jgi:RHS repeat-associated protein